MVSDMRYDKLLDILPTTNYNISKSAILAGFSEQTAKKQGKRLMATALKRQANRALERVESNSITTTEMKKTMAELVGVSSNQLFKRLKYLAFEQDKDYSTQLKILSALANEYGVIINPQDNTQITTVPVLNIVVDKPKDEAIQGDIIGEIQQ